ncbi:class I SAM-dependent methyltransferase [Brevibacterium sediminis]|uniref:class I SAM-dependent methyltransferase n=1 Tax=Brevibacterium sediminis TaxID=1857024 RepID=UPI0021755C90|nr:class I SAM-dependent methyltransferase [Brevibacterium sediminis]MCS4593868.1 class I SAM-dependent methyltransferase [Brevibacterium sediminis]
MTATSSHNDHTHADRTGAGNTGVPDSVAAWEERYAGADDAIWSGNPNESLVAVVSDMTPGRVLDVGCGEGADVVWMAENGWDATGIDLSTTAIDRARRAAESRGISAEFAVADVSTWEPDDPDRRGGFDLVTGSFLHTRLPDTREELLTRVAAHVAPGGALLLVSHATMPPWAAEHSEKFEHGMDHHHELVSPNGDFALLIGASPHRWEIELADTRTREVTSPSGEPAELEDAILLARRI